MLSDPVIYIVDDDLNMVKSLIWIIDSFGLKSKYYTRGDEFLDDYDVNQHSCLLLDVRMPLMSGPELQNLIIERSLNIPIIFMSAHCDINLTVNAIKAGAVNFLVKPFNDIVLLESINYALKVDKTKRINQLHNEMANKKYWSLTQREKQVLNGILSGKQNKTISTDLSLSLKTIEAHRASMMRKLGVKTVPQLFQFVFKYNIKEMQHLN